MSINNKMLIFVASIVVVPMFLLLIISTFILDRQIEKSAQSYLENALKIARNSMLDRLEEMKKGSKYITQSIHFRSSVVSEDIKELGSEIKALKDVYKYLDFILVLDKDGKQLFSIPVTKGYIPEIIKNLLEKVREEKTAISSEMVLELDDFFIYNSPEYKKYMIKLVNGKANILKEEFFEKMLVGIAVAPIFNPGNEKLEGFLVTGDIVNNDDYFPRIYSISVKDSFLALSADGIRVTSNIRSPKKENYIGSLIPISMESLEGSKNSYFGYVNIDDEIHVFLDEPIIDYRGKTVGVLGVGIPKQKFSVFIDTNRNAIFLVTFLCLSVMLVIGHRVSLRITRPIIQATQFAERVARGERSFLINKEFISDSKSETVILLKTFQKMAADLKASEEERKNFLEKLKEEHHQQQELAKRLREMNDELEEKVEARTQELSQAIKALRKADQVKSQFLANMSHELRTPLNAIISSSQILLERIFGLLNEKQEKYIHDIQNGGVHLLQLINDILDISKIEAGMMKLSISKFYIEDIIINSYSVVKSLAYRKNIEFNIKIAPSNFEIKADEKKLKQILYNLFSNAVKFTPEGGKVDIEAYKRDNFLQVIVRDNGIGIKEDDQERVFLEFEQADSSYEREHEGTGLGLPLSKKLVEMHGGEIYLNSKEGEGTEVIFTLPLDPEIYLDRGISKIKKDDYDRSNLSC